MVYNQFYPFEIQKLSYDYEDLEPNIGRYSVFFHYNEHYLPTLEKLNGLVLSNPNMQNIPLEQLAQNPDKDVANAAGSVFAHELYFKSLSPEPSEPSAHMQDILNDRFGSTENFLNAIKQTAKPVVGSGYVWVCENCCGGLFVAALPNYELPGGDDIRPIIALDLWEHSYYLDRQNHRSDYVDAALEILNWEEMERNLMN